MHVPIGGQPVGSGAELEQTAPVISPTQEAVILGRPSRTKRPRAGYDINDLRECIGRSKNAKGDADVTLVQLNGYVFDFNGSKILKIC